MQILDLGCLSVCSEGFRCHRYTKMGKILPPKAANSLQGSVVIANIIGRAALMNRILLSLVSDSGKAIRSTKVSMPMTTHWHSPNSIAIN